MLATLTFPTAATMHICAFCDDEEDNPAEGGRKQAAANKRPAAAAAAAPSATQEASSSAPPVKSVAAEDRARKRARNSGPPPAGPGESLSVDLAAALHRVVGVVDVGGGRSSLAGRDFHAQYHCFNAEYRYSNTE